MPAKLSSETLEHNESPDHLQLSGCWYCLMGMGTLDLISGRVNLHLDY